MSMMMERLRNRRHADRRARLIAQVIRTAPSASLRRELIDVAMRFYQ
jgi:hypothetical protein